MRASASALFANRADTISPYESCFPTGSWPGAAAGGNLRGRALKGSIACRLPGRRRRPLKLGTTMRCPLVRSGKHSGKMIVEELRNGSTGARDESTRFHTKGL